ncbi:MAG: helix-turn-helix domain-containing protein, partial [Saprospiraceae bacterium]|nr:helix-turn-helix domain-containing protein [Saprospiraceae bacterium]
QTRAGFGFRAKVLLRGISGHIARKRPEEQVPKDAFSVRQVFFRHTLKGNQIFFERMKKKEHKECMSTLVPVRDTIDVIGGKWTILILISIWEGNKHFREIERSIPKLSTKILAKALKELEMNKLITRSIVDDFPVRTEYTITEHGKTLKSVIEALRDWGLIHRREIFGK